MIASDVDEYLISDDKSGQRESIERDPAHHGAVETLHKNAIQPTIASSVVAPISPDRPSHLNFYRMSGPARAHVIDHDDEKRLQAQLGNAQSQQAKYVLNETGKTETFGEEAIDARATLYFKNCSDGEYIVDTMTTKVLLEGCNNIKVVFKKKVITGLVDIWKCNNVTFESDVKIGTLQVDICKGVTGVFKSKDLFSQCVWAGVFDLNLSFQDSDQKLTTGFDVMKKEHHSSMALNEQVDQFIVRFVKEKLTSELIVRLSNGFPTTEREARDFDRRQEENTRKLAEAAGITIARKKPAFKNPGPNEVCHCGSGKKYKKCHMAADA
ncbi:hypothetical protein PROFUN_01600 [Planoprotostelium fungivorum]|uniref:Adenylate cyclase-associated CAP C-terminal domain-containing protein n=1 Tax=Planoprotostelium fungivorum TaxID=1890364 RepID=A0A2P6NU03_9EUKA|nr:hypothetical protein PROFUN_01600 [Planoprotostelium fungivorum]